MGAVSRSRSLRSPLRETCSPHPAVEWGIAASARYIDWVMRSLVTLPPETGGGLRLDDRIFATPRRATATRLAPKRIDKPRSESGRDFSLVKVSLCAQSQSR